PVSAPSTPRLSTETVSPAFRSAAATRSGYPPPPATSPAPRVKESPSATMRKAPSAAAVASGTAGVVTGIAEGSTGSPRRPCSAAVKPAARTAAVARPSAAGKNHRTRRRPMSVTGRILPEVRTPGLTQGVQHGRERRRRRPLRRRAREALWRPGSRLGRVLRGAPGRIGSLAALVHMDGRLDGVVRTYSLGMRQRVGIAQALLSDPAVLILDEPTN